MKEVFFICKVLLIAALFSGSHAARILGMVTMPGKSHHNLLLPLMQELASRKHEVTVMSYFPQEKPLPNYKDIPLSMEKLSVFKDIDKYNMAQKTMIESLIQMLGMSKFMAEGILQNKNVQELIDSKDQQFDLIIMEVLFNEALLGFAHKFKAPVIGICPFGGTHWMHNSVGNPSPFSYVPDVFLNYGDHMTFTERLYNTVAGILEILGRELYHLPIQEAMMNKYFNNSGPLPSLRELDSQMSFLFVNSHFSISYPRPLVPNLIEVGGMHIKPPKKLPQDLQKYLDDAPEGVIYFSMGSNLQSSQLPESKRKAILEVFSKLKYKIMWKWESDELPGQPPNLLIRKWFPQADILAHPNIKLFITHGGLLSTMEAIYHGVPLLGIPIFGDQKLNMAKAELLGYGIRMNFATLTAESLERPLNKLLSNPSYKQNAEKLSMIFKDQPQAPMERAIYWVEYVLRHKGAPHLRSASLDLSWYQYFLLDVIAVIIAALVLSIGLIYFSCKTIFNALRKKQKPTSKNKKKN